MPDIKCVVLSRIRQGDVRGTNSEAVLNSTRTDPPAHIFTAIIQLAVSKHAACHVRSISLIIINTIGLNQRSKSKESATDFRAGHREISGCNANVTFKCWTNIISARILELDVQINLSCADRLRRHYSRRSTDKSSTFRIRFK